MMYSLTANSVTSNMAMTSSWTGLVFPSTAPNEISTAPVQKSALIMLQQTEPGQSEQHNARVKVYKYSNTTTTLLICKALSYHGRAWNRHFE